MNTLNKGEKPSTSERRQMIRIISDEIRKFTHLPGKKAIDFITKNVVEKYPSLKDNLCDDIISDGNVYLSKQIRNRLENLNRGQGLGVSKNKRTAEVEQQSKSSTLSEKYGCCNWQPSISENEEELQEDQRKKLVTLYERGPEVNENEMSDLVSESFALQRKEINQVTFKIEEFRKRWPCIFLKSAVMKHFFKLVEIDLESRLKEEIKKKGCRIIHFLKTVPPGSNKKELTACLLKLPNETLDETSKILLILLQLLAAYFGENFQDIYRNCEVCYYLKLNYF